MRKLPWIYFKYVIQRLLRPPSHPALREFSFSALGALNEKMCYMKKCAKSRKCTKWFGSREKTRFSVENYNFLRKITIFRGKSQFSPRNSAIFSPKHFPDMKTRFSTCATAKPSAQRTKALKAKSALKAKMRDIKMRLAVR